MRPLPYAPRALGSSTLATLLRQTLATLLRKTIATLLRKTTTSNPFRGESLFASTEQPVYRLEPSPEEREPRERWSPFFKGKEGDGG